MKDKKLYVYKVIKNYLLITAASILYGASVSLFLDPNNLAPGGVTGIAIILNRFMPVATGTWILLINIPILILGAWKFGFRFIISTVYATAVSSFFTNWMARFPVLTEDKMLAALFGGAGFAVALGLIFKAGATTGGTDILVKLLRNKFRHLKTGGLFFITDLLIVAASGFAFKDMNTALYAAVCVVVICGLFDVVLYGTDEAKLLYIISDSAEEIAKRLLADLDAGVTFLKGRGAYSSQDKKVIMCVMKKQAAPQVEEVVKELDPCAFMIVTNATEIFGEGYKNIFHDKL